MARNDQTNVNFQRPPFPYPTRSASCRVRVTVISTPSPMAASRLQRPPRLCWTQGFWRTAPMKREPVLLKLPIACTVLVLLFTMLSGCDAPIPTVLDTVRAPAAAPTIPHEYTTPLRPTIAIEITPDEIVVSAEYLHETWRRGLRTHFNEKRESTTCYQNSVVKTVRCCFALTKSSTPHRSPRPLMNTPPAARGPTGTTLSV